MTAVSLPMRFQVGARTLAAIPRRLVRIGLSLDQALADAVPMLPPLESGADGYLVTSLAAERLAALRRPELIAFVRQRYARHYVDLTIGEVAWRAALSAGARSTLKRKTKRLAELSGGRLDVRSAATPADLAPLLPAMRAVAATTYQQRLLGSVLPDDARLLALAAADRLRGWLLTIDGRPAAYLLCIADGTTLRYDHVGHDPQFGVLSPGTVLLGEALRALLTERRFARFDFTEGDGQHKRQLATGSVACVDLLLLRPTIANRATIAALSGFDGVLAWGKQAAQRPILQRWARRLRR